MFCIRETREHLTTKREPQHNNYCTCCVTKEGVCCIWCLCGITSLILLAALQGMRILHVHVCNLLLQPEMLKPLKWLFYAFTLTPPAEAMFGSLLAEEMQILAAACAGPSGCCLTPCLGQWDLDRLLLSNQALCRFNPPAQSIAVSNFLHSERQSLSVGHFNSYLAECTWRRHTLATRIFH